MLLYFFILLLFVLVAATFSRAARIRGFVGIENKSKDCFAEGEQLCFFLTTGWPRRRLLQIIDQKKNVVATFSAKVDRTNKPTLRYTVDLPPGNYQLKQVPSVSFSVRSS